MQNNSIVPYLSVTNADQAIDYYSDVFESSPYNLLRMPDGRVMHCEFQMNGIRFFLSEELPEHGGTPSPTRLGATSVAIHLYVADCDHLVSRMNQRGGEILMEPSDMFWGERFSRVRDPFGHEWGIATLLRTMSPEEIQQAANDLFSAGDG